MIFANAEIFTGNSFSKGCFEVSEGRFSNIVKSDSFINWSRSPEELTDLTGLLVIPGLIDLHSHGNSGFDFSTCDMDGLRSISDYLGRNGITTFTPASTTMPHDALVKAFRNAERLNLEQREAGCSGARLAGINMEGPYLSAKKRGAQDPAYLRNPDFEEFTELNKASGGLIRLVDIAPELDGAMDFIEKARNICTVSIAHTDADYETASAAFRNGASHITHLFNGMNGIVHRNPGPVCAAYDNPSVYAELICDGIHIKPPVIRMAFELFKDRIILISDSLACCGMPDGRYMLGNQDISLKNKFASLSDGTLAGSASNLFDMMKNVISFGIPPENAIRAATINPARQLGLDSELGSIDEGKIADFIICSKDYRILSIYIGGRRIR